MATALAFQGSLLAAPDATPAIDDAFRGVRRHRLPGGAWVDRLPGWVSASDRLFTAALDHLPWSEGTERIRGAEVARPRLVARVDADDLPDQLALVRTLSEALSGRYGVALDRLTCNLYRDGRDSVAWHGDRIARDLPTATVAVVSLGEPRPFRLRPKGGGSSMGWSCGHGDLLVMGGSCQRTCDHSVPKVASAGPRIALMFRHAYD